MNDYKKMISIVIPVYNVEKYISECLDSVINQTYSNLQIILIDDGSTDRSGIICDEYSKRDKRIEVVHQPNAGAGAAKNTGLNLIKGEYFSIIDSDDFLDLNYYKNMLDSMIKYDVDVVQCRFRNYFSNISFDRDFCFKHNQNQIYTNTRYLCELLFDWKYAVFWNKLFKSKLLTNIRFPVDRKIDDEFFTYKVVGNAQKILNINDVLYNYRMRKSSVMNDNDNINLICDRIDCYDERYKYILNKFSSLKKIYYYSLSNYILFNYNQYSDDKLLSAVKKYPVSKENVFDKLSRKIRLKDYVQKSIDMSKGEKFE